MVTFEADFLARLYLEETALPWPLAVDQERVVYRHFEMDRARWRDVWSFRVMAKYARLVASGLRLARSSGDTRQRGGDVVIDPSGRLFLGVVGDGPADRVDIDTVLAQIKRQAGHPVAIRPPTC